MSSGLLADDVTEVEMISGCSTLDCESPSVPAQQCIDKAAPALVSDVRFASMKGRCCNSIQIAHRLRFEP